MSRESTVPDWKEEIKQRLSSLKLDPTREAEIVEELTQHLEDRYAEVLSGGAPDEEARRTALAELSDSQSLAQELRLVEEQVDQEPVVLGARRINMIADLIQDLRYCVRSMRKHSLLSIAVVATLTLGISISAGVFGLFDAQALRPPVDKDVDSFVRVYSGYTTDPARLVRPGRTTLEDYLAFRDRAKSFRNLAASAQVGTVLGEEDQAEVRARLVTSNFFSVYDLEQPLMGRLLEPEDCSTTNAVVVLSEPLWRNRFAADPEIVGKVVHFNGQPVTIVGVAPIFAGMYNGAKAWFPYTLETYLKLGNNLRRPGEADWLELTGRLNPGFSRKDVAAELRLLASQQDPLYPGRITTLTFTNGSAIEEPSDRDRIMLAFAVMMGALTIFVLIVCVNVTTLLLARAAARRQEIAVRLALGAGRMRLVRMLLTETLLLASLAGLVSLYLAWHIPGILDRWLTNPGGDLLRSSAPNWRVFGYLMLITILSGAVAGLTPALESLKVNLSEMLRSSQNMPGGARGSRLYGLLIGTQVALSFFFLCGAGFFVSASLKTANFDRGFETREVIWTRMITPSRTPEQRTGSFHRTLAERLAALPGVQSVAYSNRSINDSLIMSVQVPGHPIREVELNVVSPNYFTTLGIPIVSGNAFGEADCPCGSAGCSVVVSQQLAREFWPNENPLGQTLRDPNGHSFEVVGIARDLSSPGGPDEPLLYLPWNPDNPANPFVRFSGDGGALARVVAGTIRDIAPELSVTAGTMQSLRDEQTESLWRETQLVVFLCAVAVILAVVGIYGVVAFAVNQRTKEIGIRIALGAGNKDIYRAVLGSRCRSIILGLVIGLAVSATTFSSVGHLLRDVNVRDPITYAVTAILLAGVALVAMLVPARRATRVDPMTALRHE